MVDVELDQTENWDRGDDWQKLANNAIAAALHVSPFSGLNGIVRTISLSVNLSDSDEVHALNRQWRGKDNPTNILSFPMLEPEELDEYLARWDEEAGDGEPNEILLGDLILAHKICAAQADEKGVPLPQYVTHLLVHGTLHLLGYDHIDDAQGDEMEALEVKALASLGLPNPYD